MAHMMQVHKPSDVPDGQHFAVLVYKTSGTYVPGDERSRTNPGHGYPEHTETSDSFEHWVCMPGDTDVLESFLLTLETPRPYKAKTPYVVLDVAGRVSTKTEIKVQIVNRSTSLS